MPQRIRDSCAGVGVPAACTAGVGKATLKVGVVAFGGTAIVVRDLEKITDAADLTAAVTDGNIRGLHGTNIQAGLIEADKMLSKDTEVSDK